MYHEKEKAATGLEPVTAKPFLPNPYLDYFDKLEFICLCYVLSLIAFSSLTNPFFLLYSHGSFCVLPPYLQTIPP